MSIEALTVVLNHSQAKGAVKLILIGIANHINPDNDGAWPSQAKLASYANCSERYVHDAVEELVALGELRAEVRGGKSTGGNKSNRYWINISCPENCDGTTNHRLIENTNSVQDIPNSVQQTLNSVANTLNPSSDEPLRTVNKTLKEPLKAKPHLLHEDWLPDENLVEMFITKWPLLNMSEQTESFKLHYMSKGDKRIRWDLTYQQWMNRAQKWAAEKQPEDKPRPKILGDWR